MRSISYSEILELNRDLGRNLRSGPYKIQVLSNCTVNLLKEILEYSLRSQGINAQVNIGDYDNIVQNSLKCGGANLVIIFWEVCNIIDGLQYKIELFNKEELEQTFVRTKSEIDLVFENLNQAPLLIVNKFTTLPFLSSNFRVNNFAELSDRLNHYLETNIPDNLKLVDSGKVIADIGIKQSIDLRNYYSSKALYSVNFWKAYSEHIKPFVMSANGKAMKAVIFDCDNTLWKGILGEDGSDNIEMSPKTKEGAIFAEIQSISRTLSAQGILIGLCTKNNHEDVDEIIRSHPDMQLRDEHIAIKKVNWSDKVANLKEIAEELNIGLDSIVFVDDSPFETNLIREHLPEVVVLQVPEQLCDYPALMRENLGLFYDLSLTEEDRRKTEMYRAKTKRANIPKGYASLDAYFTSLGLAIMILEDDEAIIPRISQMTQKTNQFNITTRRYTETEIGNLIRSSLSKVYAFSLTDKFGDSGVAGLGIVHLDWKAQAADIDTFLMSCRIIGRNAEYAFMDHICASLKGSNVRTITASYVRTSKNQLTEDFYDRCGFRLVESTASVRNYSVDVDQYEPKKVSYIKIIDGKENQKNHFAGIRYIPTETR
jgi:FkbH-like protein